MKYFDLPFHVLSCIFTIVNKNIFFPKKQVMNNQNFKLLVPGSKTLDFVVLGEIVRCEGLQNYTRVYLKNGKSILSSSNIGVFKSVLSHLKFYCTHKSHLINLNHIVRYHKIGHVEMIDKSSVPISRRKKEEFQKIIRKSEDILSLQASQ